MKKIAVLLLSVLILNISLSAQKNELITVKAGNRILDYFPFEERYRYPEFISGRVFFNNGVINTVRLNLNFLTGEMEFIQGRDTLAIVKKRDIRTILVASDTFFYDNNYLEEIAGSPIKVCVKNYIKLKEVLKKDSYGTSGSGTATNSYGSLPKDGNFYKLAANEDMVFQRVREYFMLTPDNGFVPFKKKAILQLFPQHEDKIKDFLKSNDTDFNSGDDLINLTRYIGSLKK